jgi:hypothetical protein
LPLPLAGLLNDQGQNAAECLNGRGGSTKSRKALGSSWRTTGSLARTIDANKICVVAGRSHGYVWNESRICGRNPRNTRLPRWFGENGALAAPAGPKTDIKLATI